MSLKTSRREQTQPRAAEAAAGKRDEERNRPQSTWHLPTRAATLFPSASLRRSPGGQVLRRRRRPRSRGGRGREPLLTRGCSAPSSALPGWNRPSGTQAGAPKFQAGTVTTASAFFPEPAGPLPSVNFSRELTRHFRARGAPAAEEGRINPRAPGPEVSAWDDAFSLPPANERRRLGARGGGSGSGGGTYGAGKLSGKRLAAAGAGSCVVGLRQRRRP